MRRHGPLLAYAALTGGAVALTLLGEALGLRLDVAVLGAISLAGVGIGFVERAAPFERTWNTPKGDSAVDVLHLLLSTIAVEVLFALAAARVPGMGLWPTGLPFIVQLALALLLAEFGGYWAHRWMHGPLWRIHVVHHSARRLHALNASRNHPLDTLALLIAAGLPLVVLGAPPRVLAVLVAFALVHLQFQHANARLELGPLNWLLAGPELHRWHHSRVPAEAHGNYGHVLMVWDVVFRTRVAPHGRRPPANVGLFDREGLPETYGAHLASAFRKP